ncbi:hypothetical protein [Bradyrhizobium sp. CCBAU 51745]|uniref:hypothetical protein n=1 Tax=Bradyrhizobium sp. CCBAU 51745 TaxID=1325099 RepID=UPI002306DC33|nr:hypothetical protein [Bradyrhizobium sp. CCBAU 51745]
MIDIQSPPPAWIAPAPPGMVELELSLPQIDLLCRTLGAAAAEGKQIFGCSMWGSGGCLIIVPKIGRVSSMEDQARVREHEVAHCNGWRHEDR